MIPFQGKKLLFVLGRIAGYNPQHDLTPSRLRQICAAAQAANFEVMPVGWPGPTNGSKSGTVNHLVKTAAVDVHPCLDLRDWNWLTGSDVADERARAYFWRCVIDYATRNAIPVKLVGGRSGSTDLPAFMGMDVLCWDECHVWNPEYLRLLITAPILLQVTHTAQTRVHAPLQVLCDPAPQFRVDVEAFLNDQYATPKLVFEVSGNLRKRGAGALFDEQIKLLRAFEKDCRIIFALPYDTNDPRGQHFSFVRDPSSAPLAFNALNHLLRPYYTDPKDNLDDLTDLGVFLRYDSLARQRGPHSKLSFASTIKVPKSISPDSFDFYFI